MSIGRRTRGAPGLQWARWELFGCGALVVLSGVIIAAVCGSIRGSVREVSALAQAGHPGDPVSALIGLAADETATVRDRNRAVWALGQLGDTRALSTVQRLQASVVADSNGTASALSPYELGKAVGLLAGEANPFARVWRAEPGRVR